MFGLGPSPYLCTRAYYWGEEILRSDRRLIDKSFKWNRVVMNLPGTTQYNHIIPWVYKWDALGRRIVTNYLTFIDDTRVFGGYKHSCVREMYRIATLMNFLGGQITARKMRAPS